MFKIIDSRRVLLQILVICFLFSFVKLDIEIENITSFIKKDYTETKYFLVDLEDKSIDYLNIQIEGKDEYAIIYYKDDSLFENRNQMIKSSSNANITKMWLNNEQIKKAFYLSVMCSKKNCKYNLQFESKEELELECGEFYTYYVTEETKKMKFLIKGKGIFESEENGDLSIWAQGYEKIKTDLNQEPYFQRAFLNEKKGIKYGLEAYQIPIDNEEKLNLAFKVEGTLRDLITIGVLLFSNQNICKTPIKEINNQISGYLIDEKDYNKEACFIFPEKEKPNINSLLENESSFKLEANNLDNQANIYCLKMINNNFEGLYSFNYNKNEDLDDKINIFPPLKLGQFYQLNMRKGENIGLVPIFLDSDFKYFTYKVLEKKGKFKAYTIKCDNYPFCNKTKDVEYLINYNAASRTYFKKFSDNAVSPIDQNQIMIIIECETDICSINANIYTENNQIAIEPLISYQNFQIKENIDQLNISSFYKNFLINVEYESIEDVSYKTTSCSIKDTNDVNKNNNNNNDDGLCFYEITNNYDSKPDFILKLNSKEKSVYSVAVANITKSDNDSLEITITPGMNYLIKIDNNKANDTIVKIMNLSKIGINDNSIYYINFYSDNCTIKVNSLQDGEKYIIKNKKKFYYYFFNISNTDTNINTNNEFKITKLENNDKCLVGVSLFEYKNVNNELNSIYLLKDKPHTFVFDHKNDQVKYRYLFVDNDKDLEIIITPNNVEKSKIVSFAINDNEISSDKDFELKEKEKKSIKVDDVHIYCNNDYQPCKIEIIIKAQEIKENPSVEISVEHRNKIEPDKTKDGTKPKTRNNLITIIFIILGTIILVIIVTYFMLRNKNSYDKLSNEVNAISYAEVRDNEDEKRDSLF